MKEENVEPSCNSNESDDNIDNDVDELLFSILGDNLKQINPNRYQRQLTDYDSSSDDDNNDNNDEENDLHQNEIQQSDTCNNENIIEVEDDSIYVPLTDEEFGEYISNSQVDHYDDSISSEKQLEPLSIINQEKYDSEVKLVPKSYVIPSIPPLTTRENICLFLL